MFKNTTNTTKNDPQSDALRDAANQAGATVREAAENIEASARNFYHSASNEANHVADTVTSQIRNNPIQSACVAAGIGFVLGFLFRR